MNDESLRELLARVHERLSAPDAVDPESRRLLATVMRDIDAALTRQVPLAPEEHAPRMEALAVQFEAEHPSIAQLLRQIATVLGQAGI